MINGHEKRSLMFIEKEFIAMSGVMEPFSGNRKQSRLYLNYRRGYYV